MDHARTVPGAAHVFGATKVPLVHKTVGEVLRESVARAGSSVFLISHHQGAVSCGFSFVQAVFFRSGLFFLFFEMC
jgi:hypothetical protein